MWRSEDTGALLIGSNSLQLLCNMVQSFFKKLCRESSQDSAVPPLGKHTKELEARPQQITCLPVFTAALVTIAER